MALAPVGVALALLLNACGGASASGGSSGQRSQTATANAAPVTSTPAAKSSLRSGVLINVRSSQYGRILNDGSNRTIYQFTRDRGTTSTCYGACARAWPPVLGRGVPHDGRLTGRLGTTRRSDGSLQVTYAGHPLYYYVGDVKPGQILCQDVDEFGGTWLVTSPRGTAVR